MRPALNPSLRHFPPSLRAPRAALERACRTFVVLPVYNLGARAVPVARDAAEFVRRHPDFEFCFVDDGSRDDTAERLRAALQREGAAKIEVLSLAQNSGKGAAVRHGFLSRERAADYFVFLDGDLPYPFADLFVAISALEVADVAIGNRHLARQGHRAPWVRHRMGRMFNFVARHALNLSYGDTQAGIKAFRREAALDLFGQLTIEGFSFDVELLVAAERRGWRVVEFPAHLTTEHAFEVRPVRLLRHALRMSRDALAIRWNLERGRYDRR